MKGLRVLGVHGLLLITLSCGRATRAADGGGGSASVAGDGAAGNADDPDTASNGVPIPAHDDRDSCAGLGLVFAAQKRPGTCPPITCPCVDDDLSTFSPAERCIAAVDCGAFCDLAPASYSRLQSCIYGAPCTREEDCDRDQRCEIAAPGVEGVCTEQCSSDQDCSFACIRGPDGSSCGSGLTGAYCNRHQQCASGVCLLPDGQYFGVCGDGEVGSPCLRPADCKTPLGCVARLPYGVCADGSVGSLCLASADCMPGSVCVQSHNVCSARTVGSLCDKPSDCASGFCSTLLGNSCTDGKDGAPCNDATECGVRACLDHICSSGGPGSYCVVDSDCPGIACMLPAHFCADPKLLPYGSPCQANQDCQSQSCHPQDGPDPTPYCL